MKKIISIAAIVFFAFLVHSCSDQNKIISFEDEEGDCIVPEEYSWIYGGWESSDEQILITKKGIRMRYKSNTHYDIRRMNPDRFEFDFDKYNGAKISFLSFMDYSEIYLSSLKNDFSRVTFTDSKEEIEAYEKKLQDNPAQGLWKKISVSFFDIPEAPDETIQEGDSGWESEMIFLSGNYFGDNNIVLCDDGNMLVQYEETVIDEELIYDKKNDILLLHGSYIEEKYVRVAGYSIITDIVDLGLSVKWASCNLGASTPEGYGDYYAWGATEPWYEDGYAQEDPQTHWKSGKSGGYKWVNCPFNGGSDDFDESYLNAHKSECVDANNVLLPANDAAHVNLGGNWRMPTNEEFDELRNTSNCSWTWTTLDGIKGYMVQSKKTGYTDNWIFLPAAGCRSYGGLSNVGSYGYYWSSSLATGSPDCAYYMLFGSGIVGTNYFDRYRGQSVRPVSE